MMFLTGYVDEDEDDDDDDDDDNHDDDNDDIPTSIHVLEFLKLREL